MDVSSLSQALTSAENNSNALPQPPDPFRLQTLAAGARFVMPHKAGEWLQFQTVYACDASETLLFFRTRVNVDEDIIPAEIKWMTLETKRAMRLLVYKDSATDHGWSNPIHTDVLRKVLSVRGAAPKTVRSQLNAVQEVGRQFAADDALPEALSSSIRVDAKRHFSQAVMLLESPMENARKSDLEYGHEQALVGLARLYQCDGFVMQHSSHDKRAHVDGEVSQVCFLPHANDGIDILVEQFDITVHQKELTDYTAGTMDLLWRQNSTADSWFGQTDSVKIATRLFGLDEIIQAHGSILEQMDNRVTRRPTLSQFLENKTRREKWKMLISLGNDYDASENKTELLQKLMNDMGAFLKELAEELDVVLRDFLDA